MRTVIETPTFQKEPEKIRSEDERLAFIDWISANPPDGEVIPAQTQTVRVKSAGRLLERASTAVFASFIST